LDTPTRSFVHRSGPGTTANAPFFNKLRVGL
jgi:hypothetical protein